MRSTIIVCFYLLSCYMSKAQQGFSISGTVRNGDEAAVNATVRLEPGSRQRISNDNGFFRFSKIVPGSYKITISMVGYETQEKDVRLTGRNITLDINLVLLKTV